MRWERLRPKLGQKLDEAQLKSLRTAIGWTRQHGGSAILDVHNYGRYFLKRPSGVRECIIDEKIDGSVPVSRQHFADLWGRLAEAFRDKAAVAAYGLMNEPHDIRRIELESDLPGRRRRRPAAPTTKRILVAGDDWSSTPRFVRANGPWAWVKDPADNVAYEAHCYFDRDGSGKYKLSYQDELARTLASPHEGLSGWSRLSAGVMSTKYAASLGRSAARRRCMA